MKEIQIIDLGKINEKIKEYETVDKKVEDIKNEVNRKWFFAYDILENIRNENGIIEYYTSEKRTNYYLKIIIIFFAYSISMFIIFMISEKLITRDNNPIEYSILDTFGFIWLLMLIWVVYSVIKSFFIWGEKRFLKTLFWFDNSRVLILNNLALVWRKAIKIKNWDVSKVDLILDTLSIYLFEDDIDSLLAKNNYKKIPVDKNTKKLFQFKELFFELEELSKNVKNIRNKIEKSIQNINSWKWEFQILSEKLDELYEINETILSKKDEIIELFPEVIFKKYNLWLNESFILPLQWIKDFLIKNLEQVKNLISENENNQSEQIKLLQKRLEMNKNLLEKKISELDAEIKKLES